MAKKRQSQAVWLQVLTTAVYLAQELHCLRLLLLFWQYKVEHRNVQCKEDSQAQAGKAGVIFGGNFKVERTGNVCQPSNKESDWTRLQRNSETSNSFFREWLHFLVVYEFNIDHVNMNMRWCGFLFAFCLSQFFRYWKMKFSGSMYEQKNIPQMRFEKQMQ